MSKRTADITAFLDGTRWAQWVRHPLAGDASARRYWRLNEADETVILMDADPATGQDTVPFAKITKWLLAQGLCAPEIHLHNPEKGLMLITDLGAHNFAQWITTHNADARMLYKAATDVIIHLQRGNQPPSLSAMTPQIAGEMLNITSRVYANLPDDPLANPMATALLRHCDTPDVVSLRDFHAENLIWRSDLSGLRRVGLLDYQDAFLAPIGYDLVSLLRDVRRKVDPQLASAMLDYFIAETGTDTATFPAAFATLAVQRNLRILGVFAELALIHNKPRYIVMIPHIWEMIMEDLAHPALTDLRATVTNYLPPPKGSAIKDLL